MEKQVILTSAVRFCSIEDVEAYKALSVEALPCNDVEFNEVTRYLVGWEHIVLFGRTGRRLAALKRRDFIGMAIDGKPVLISGDSFKPFSTESKELDAKAELDTLMRRLGYVPYSEDGGICYVSDDDHGDTIDFGSVASGLDWANEALKGEATEATEE